jgi:hypothetical protein
MKNIDVEETKQIYKDIIVNARHWLRYKDVHCSILHSVEKKTPQKKK